MADTILGKASEFAIKSHGKQLYGRKPYHVHLLDVVGVLRRFYDWDELPQEYIDAAWLHDSIEDTGVTATELSRLFGEKVAALVGAVTNLPKSFGPQKARDEMLYANIRNVSGAINVKLADRIANVEQCISYGRIGRAPARLFDKYSKAWPDFQVALRRRCRGEGYPALEMWEHLQMLIDLGNEAKEGRMKA
jgi:HD domain